MEIFNSAAGKTEEIIPSLCYVGCKLKNPFDFQYINWWSFNTLARDDGTSNARDKNNNVNATGATLKLCKNITTTGIGNSCITNTSYVNRYDQQQHPHYHHQHYYQCHASAMDNDTLGGCSDHHLNPLKYTQNFDERAQYVALKVPFANSSLLRARTFHLWTYQLSTILFVDVVTQRIYNFMATPSCQHVFCYMTIDIESKLTELSPVKVTGTKHITKITNTVRLVSADRQHHTLLKYQIPLISENLDFFCKFPTQRVYAWNAHVRYDLAKPHTACNFTVHVIPGECLLHLKCFSPELTTRQFNKCINLLDTHYHKPSIATNAAIFECPHEEFYDERLRTNPMPAHLSEFFTIVAVRETLQKYKLNESIVSSPLTSKTTSTPSATAVPPSPSPSSSVSADSPSPISNDTDTSAGNDACNFGGGINNRYMDAYTPHVYRLNHCPSAEISFYIRYRNRIHVLTKEINLVDIYVHRQSVLALVTHKPQVDYYTSAWDRIGKDLCDEFTSNLTLLDVKFNINTVSFEDDIVDDITEHGKSDNCSLSEATIAATATPMMTSTVTVPNTDTTDGGTENNKNENIQKSYIMSQFTNNAEVIN